MGTVRASPEKVFLFTVATHNAIERAFGISMLSNNILTKQCPNGSLHGITAGKVSWFAYPTAALLSQ